MTRWFCIQCKRAGLASDRVCCSSALLAACETDVMMWYRLRVASKPAGWDATRWDRRAQIAAICGWAVRSGRRFVTARVVA